jgi:hypothetical protein
MIIVKIHGGVGNQLFQLALALSLKARNPDNIVAIDTSFYNNTNSSATPREILLQEFNVEKFQIATINYLGKKNILDKLKGLLKKADDKFSIYETTNLFMPSVLNSKQDAYLNGYWQSYHYFNEIDTTLKKQFTPKHNLTSKSLEYKKIIASYTNSISLHIRRGDYLTKYNEFYYQLTVDHYYKAIDLIKNKLKIATAHLFIFSDDIEWCKSQFTSNDDITFIDNTIKPDHEDLLLMSYCQHNIIANSSYSWWAAWLNNNTNKIVIAPKKWYIKQEPEFNASIYPPTWTVL